MSSEFNFEGGINNQPDNSEPSNSSLPVHELQGTHHMGPRVETITAESFQRFLGLLLAPIWSRPTSRFCPRLLVIIYSLYKVLTMALIDPLNFTNCQNTTDPLLATCNGHGECRNGIRARQWECQCSKYWDQDSNCRLSHFEIIGSSYIAAPIVRFSLFQKHRKL